MTKLRLKYGALEVEFEGTEEFLTAHLQGLLEAVSSLRPAPGMPATPSTDPRQNGATSEELSVSTIAQRLNVARGPDLIMSAALSLVRGGSEKFEKKTLREQIKLAPAFYKKTYSDNFDNYVKTLVKNGRLSDTGASTYAIPASELTRLTSALTAAGA